jgi:hypothetical protein
LSRQRAWALPAACDSGLIGPWRQSISYRDFLPNWQRTDEDAKRLGNINNGPLTGTQTKAMRKWYQLLAERRYLVGHMFYWPDHSKWLFFFHQNFDIYHPLPNPAAEIARDLVWAKARREVRGAAGGMFFRLSESL